MPAPRLTRAALLIENQHLRERLAAMVPPSYSREIENLKAKLAALQPEDDFVLLKQIVVPPGYTTFRVWRWGTREEIDTKLIGKRRYYSQRSVTAYIRRLEGG
jgi:hypothetical protein